VWSRRPGGMSISTARATPRQGMTAIPSIDPQTAFTVVGLLYVLMPFTAWTILHSRHDRGAVALWCGGGILYGVAFLLVGARGAIPAWLSILVSNVLAFAAYALRAAALHRELGHASIRSRHSAGLLVLWGVCSLAYVATYEIFSFEAPRLLLSNGVQLAGSAGLGWLAWRLYRQRAYRSAAMLAVAYGVFTAALAVRMIAVASAWQDARALTASADFVLMFVSSIVAAVYGNLGYLGFALETMRGREVARTAELAREQARAHQMEGRVEEQSALAQERGRLLTQREDMLAMLAHEVRQPLNNASAALQSAAQALLQGEAERESAALRVQRASAVIAHVTGLLDNTLADAVLLNEGAAARRQDIEIDVLVALTLGDIPPARRPRVRYERMTATRTASLDLGLIRLALRNLLVNALACAPDHTPVILQVSDTDDPLELIIEVRDQGPGIEPALRERLFSRGVRGSASSSGHGLGLYIVRRVMQMHGGKVEVIDHDGPGITMRLTIPQAIAE